jgi:hypothetical protein
MHDEAYACGAHQQSDLITDRFTGNTFFLLRAVGRLWMMSCVSIISAQISSIPSVGPPATSYRPLLPDEIHIYMHDHHISPSVSRKRIIVSLHWEAN